MSLNPHLFLLEAENNETFLCSSNNFHLGIPEMHEGKIYTNMVVANGMGVRIPGSPEHIYKVLKRQTNYRKQDWPDGYGSTVLSNLEKP